jgi:hypothetical protein
VDIQTIDNAYESVQRQSQDTAAKLQTLGQKLQRAAQAGDQNAREWLLDLREIALAVRDEESQVAGLLQAIHGFAANQIQQPPPQQQPYPMQQPYPAQPPYAPQPPYPAQPPYAPQPPYPPQQPGYGAQNPLSGFLNSGFGRALEMGAGIGLGEDLIGRLF